MRFIIPALFLVAASASFAESPQLPALDASNYQILQVFGEGQLLVTSQSHDFICDTIDNGEFLELGHCKPVLTADYLSLASGSANAAAEKLSINLGKLNKLSQAEIDRKLAIYLQYQGCEIAIGLPGNEIPDVISKLSVHLGVHKIVADQAGPELRQIIRASFDRLSLSGTVEYKNGKARVNLKDCS